MQIPPDILEQLFQAYFDARKNKRNTHNQLQFELNFEKKIFALFEELKQGSYRISKSICFIIFHPVQREIFAGDFRDRVIHHLVFNALNPTFEKIFIHDSYSCRKGKGPLFGIKRLEYFHRSCSNNYQKECFFLKLDIEGYFMSIDQKRLFQKTQRTIQQKQIPHSEFWLWLLNLIVFHNPTKNCIIKGDKKDWHGLPHTKSLFYASHQTGLPIGNLTSQLFGNVYLNDFDHFMKSHLKCKHYGRYVDDFVILHEKKEFLTALLPQIKTFLKKDGKLTLHPKKIHLQPCKNGIPFLGAVIKPYRTYIRNRTKGSFFKKIQYWKNIQHQHPLSSEERMCCLSCLNSYLGLMNHLNAFRLQQKIITEELSPHFDDLYMKKSKN